MAHDWSELTIRLRQLLSQYADAMTNDKDYRAAMEISRQIEREARELTKLTGWRMADDILAQFDREAAKKRQELEEIEAKRAFFLAHFGRYFDAVLTDTQAVRPNAG